VVSAIRSFFFLGSQRGHFIPIALAKRNTARHKSKQEAQRSWNTLFGGGFGDDELLDSCQFHSPQSAGGMISSTDVVYPLCASNGSPGIRAKTSTQPLP
jgi:hypothetical protein